MDFYYAYLPVLGVLALYLFTSSSLRVEHKTSRYFVFWTSMVLGIYYLYWRVTQTLWIGELLTFQGIWVLVCFIIEVMLITEIMHFKLLLLRFTDRRKQAHLYEKALRSLPPGQLPHIDVLVTSFSEGEDVLERTLLGCLHLDWPKDKIRVWMCDDGDRDWLRDLCQELGVSYVRRHDKKHSKAGNINHMLHLTHGKYFACFDADFVPHRNFLYRTMGFFTDPKVAIVQTPQHFFNKDYIQSNLHAHNSLSDENRIFFDVLMPARDGWDVVFWCGSCSVARTDVIKKYGGISTDSITEDLLTSIHLLQHGFVVRYLNESLSHGLVAESVDGIAKQRKRWCRGNIQAIYSNHGIFQKGLSFSKNFLFFPFYWILNPIGRMVTLFIPIIYLFTHTYPLYVDHYFSLIHYQTPFILWTFLVSFWYSPRHYVPFVSTASFTVQAINILPTLLHSLIDPFGKKDFEVTPKGKAVELKRTHTTTLVVATALFVATFLGILIHVVPGIKSVADDGFFPVAAFWSINNVIILGVTMLLSFEHPRWREHERFKFEETMHVQFEKGGPFVAVHCHDISTGGCRASVKEAIHVETAKPIKIRINDVGDFDAVIRDVRNHNLNIEFLHTDRPARHRLLQHIYTGRYKSETPQVDHGNLIVDLFWRVFGSHKKHEDHWVEIERRRES